MRRLWRILVGMGALACMFVGAGTAQAAGSASHDFGHVTCSGSPSSPGIVAPGEYESLVIQGVCVIPVGRVTVNGTLAIDEHAALDASSSSAVLVVHGRVIVEFGGLFVLGCTSSGCTSTHDHIYGNVDADGAMALIFHHNTINGSISQRNGGGGFNCNPNPLLGGSPTFSDYEDNQISGSLSVIGLRSCWLGLFRNRVHGNVNVDSNFMADPDANEVATNLIFGNLVCFDNHPHAQLGDSGGMPNVVFGRKLGECAKL